MLRLTQQILSYITHILIYFYQITARYPRVHGSPVHLGDPTAIGIADIGKPDYGEAVTIKRDEICVFWVQECVYFAPLIFFYSMFLSFFYPLNHILIEWLCRHVV